MGWFSSSSTSRLTSSADARLRETVNGCCPSSRERRGVASLSAILVGVSSSVLDLMRHTKGNITQVRGVAGVYLLESGHFSPLQGYMFIT